MFALVAVVLAITLLYLYFTRTYNYWAKKGVKYDKPLPLFGNFLRVFAQRISQSEHICELYEKYKKETFFGYYVFLRPTLVIRDPELVKNVLATDFYHFHARGAVPVKEMNETLLRNLFTTDGDLWKLLRQRMTPAFTSGKLKAMFPLIVEKSEVLRTFAEDAARSGKEVDLKDLMARYTTDFIGAVGFGIDSQSMTDENSTFRELGKRIVAPRSRDNVAFLLKLLFPKYTQNLRVLDPFLEKSIGEILNSVRKQRNNRPSQRNDFIDQLMVLQQKGKISVESLEFKNADGTPKIVEMELDDQLMIAQMFLFFGAGFETSSSATSYTLHQLAFNPDVQRKCQDDIDAALSRYDNKLCYDAIAEMKYLDLALKEGLRMWPALGVLQRRCEKPYLLPGTDITIDKDVDIFIPVLSLQNDEKYFPEPDRFIPERFLPENKQHHNYCYLPFGEGPRACIGERLGRMQSLAGLAALLSRFSVEPSESSVRKPLPDPKSSTLTALGGIPLRIVERKL